MPHKEFNTCTEYLSVEDAQLYQGHANGKIFLQQNPPDPAGQYTMSRIMSVK